MTFTKPGKVSLVADRRFLSDIPLSTNQIDRRNKTDILLKVALNTHILKP